MFVRQNNDLRAGFPRQTARQPAVLGFEKGASLGGGWWHGKIMLFYFIVPSPLFQENINLLLKFILLPKRFRTLAPSPSQKQDLLVAKGHGSQLALPKHLLLGGFSLGSASHSLFTALLLSLADEHDRSAV